MAAHAFQYSDELTSLSCTACGVMFAIPVELERALRNSHKEFYCPNGHSLVFRGETEAEKLKRELERERQRREMAEREAQQESRRATRATRKLERFTTRVKNGVCPCCNRTFQNLARHMATKHPDHTAEVA